LTPLAIKRLRTKLKLNKTQFAALIGVNRMTVHGWELGKHTPKGAANLALTQLQAKAKTPGGTK
jgi:DNA-binding transcriptional regulator YiaG